MKIPEQSSLFNSQIPDIQSILKKNDPLVLLRKISKFRKLNIARMSDAEIHQAILDVLCTDV